MPVRIVDIDERSLAEIGQWPWPRHVLADLTNRLAELGAAVIAFDILFAEPDRLSPATVLNDPRISRALRSALPADDLALLDNDLLFASALAGVPTALGIAETAAGPAPPEAKAGFALVGDDPAAAFGTMSSATSLVPYLADAAGGIGALSVSPFFDVAITREVPIIWRTPNGLMPSLALEALRLALGESTFLVLASDQGESSSNRVRVGGYEALVSRQGLMRVWYRADDPELYVSATDVLSGDEGIRDRIDGHIVFVGTSAAGLLDIQSTPLGERVPGVSIHAQIVEQVLGQQFLVRTDFHQGLEIAVFLALGVFITALLAVSGPAISVAAGGVAALAILAASWLAFLRAGVLLDVTYPLAGGFVAFSTMALFQYFVVERDRRQIRRSFAKYVAPEVLGEIERRGHRIELGGEVREVTILFCDVRHFTMLSRKMPPDALVDLLNRLFSLLSEQVLREHGTIDKFIGDSLMAFWNAPIEVEHHQRSACLAALRMRNAVKQFNAARAVQGEAPIEVAIGMASGFVCVGNVGSAERFNYSVIGETVNVAARIEAACRHVGWDILVSEQVANGAPDLPFLNAGRLELRGVAERVACAMLVGDSATASAPGFVRLRATFSELTGLRASSVDVSERRAELLRVAEPLGIPIGTMVERLDERLADYRPDAADRTSGPRAPPPVSRPE